MGMERLAGIAAALGSDVPLFLGPAAARIRGRGERVEPVFVPSFAAVLLTPPLHCATAKVYQTYDALGAGPLEPFDPACLRDITPCRWRPLLRNDLFAAACRECPDVRRWHDRFSDACGGKALMTGSGSAMFVLDDDDSQALRLLEGLGAELRACARVVTSNPW